MLVVYFLFVCWLVGCFFFVGFFVCIYLSIGFLFVFVYLLLLTGLNLTLSVIGIWHTVISQM